jgi:general secretion pathway protein I
MTPYNKGFTLLEVMIALTIFALLATTMSQTTTSAVDNQLTIEQTLFANWIAENEIINLRSVPWADIKTDKTDYEMANQEWVIKKTVSIKKSFSGVAIPLEVKEVLVSVALKSQTSSLISLTAFLANE